jgi:hypothetical protein
MTSSIDIVLRLVRKTLQRYKIKYLESSFALQKKNKIIFIQFNKQVKKCRKCAQQDEIKMTQRTEHSQNTYFWVHDHGQNEFELGFKYYLWPEPFTIKFFQHQTSFNLCDPKSFQKIHEFISPHLRKIRRKPCGS